MMLRSDPYEKYLSSDSEWLNCLPLGWKQQRVKDIFRLVTDTAPDNNAFELLSLYTNIGVKPRKDLEARGNKASSTDGYWLVKKGDIVVNKLLAWMGAIGLSEYDGVTSPAYDILRKINSSTDERFFSYLFRTERAQQIFKRYSRGIMDVRLRLYFDKFGAITLLVPPYSIQRTISDYLDIKTAQIDQKIDLLSQKAEKYGKLKQSLINETVTRGLDKTVAMKDSGVEWIGDVPVHWGIKRVKELGNLVLGKMLDNKPAPDKFLKCYLKSKNIRWLTPDVSVVEEMYFSLHEISLYRIKCGDLLLSEGGEVGKTSHWNNELDECYIQNSVHKFTANRHNLSRYFLYLSFAVGQAKYYDSIVNVVSIKHLTKEKLSRVIWLSPPLMEQQAIVDYLDEKTAQIDRIIETIHTQIEKLKELRKTLINDVVTGKIKVVD